MVDLVINPERYTGYRGELSRRIWRAIYEENCFKTGLAKVVKDKVSFLQGCPSLRHHPQLHFFLSDFTFLQFFSSLLVLVSCKIGLGKDESVFWLISECLFACLKEWEASQMTVFLFGMLPLSLKQANKHP